MDTWSARGERGKRGGGLGYREGVPLLQACLGDTFEADDQGPLCGVLNLLHLLLAVLGQVNDGLGGGLGVYAREAEPNLEDTLDSQWRLCVCQHSECSNEQYLFQKADNASVVAGGRGVQFH